jgi:hypothetical protein
VEPWIVAGYFFIGGAPKSGTTWMQRSLDLHPEIVCSGEGHLHEFIVRPLAEMIDRYNAKMSTVAETVYEGKPYCPAVSRRELAEIARTIMVLLMGRRTKSGARLIGDKTPAYAWVVDDLAVLFPEMKFVFMVRDPRDVVASRIGQALRTGYADAADRSSETYRKIVKGVGWDWRTMVQHTRAFAERRPAQITTVRYEDLLGNRRGELARVFDFLGVSTSRAQLDEIVGGSSFEAFSGGRRPGTEDLGSFYRKGVAGDWRNHLSDEALELLHAECGAELALAGYGDAAAPQPGSAAA